MAGSEGAKTAATDAGKQLYRAEALEAWLRPQREDPPALPPAPRNAPVAAAVFAAFGAACWLAFGLPLPRSSRWDATLDRGAGGCLVRWEVPAARDGILARAEAVRFVGPGGLVVAGLGPRTDAGGSGTAGGPTRLTAAAPCPAGDVLPVAGQVEVSLPSRPLLASRPPEARP